MDLDEHHSHITQLDPLSPTVDVVIPLKANMDSEQTVSLRIDPKALEDLKSFAANSATIQDISDQIT